MPTPRKVNGNSEGEGGFKSPMFLKESMTLKWNFWRGGGFNLKNLPWEGYGYFLEQHNLQPTGQFHEKWYPILDPNTLIYIPYATVNCLKTIYLNDIPQFSKLCTLGKKFVLGHDLFLEQILSMDKYLRKCLRQTGAMVYISHMTPKAKILVTSRIK